MAKNPKHTYKPSVQKKPYAVNQKSQDQEKVAWRFSAVDRDGKWKCSLSVLNVQTVKNILRKLHDFDSRKWSEIKGNKSHNIPVSKICSDAQKRLIHIKRDDIDTLFSIRISGRERIWGIRDQNVFSILWWDPKHEVYPSKKKHT